MVEVEVEMHHIVIKIQMMVLCLKEGVVMVVMVDRDSKLKM